MAAFRANTLSDLGHRLLVETSGPRLLPQERDILAELQPRAFIFRARNFDFKKPYQEWHQQFEVLLSEIKKTVGHQQLLLSIDHEGGRVVRPPLPITRFPYAALWGDRVADVAKAMATELKSIGLNTNWAPVADVLTNGDSKVIGQRAFGNDPDTVSRKACLMAKVLTENGVLPGAKHFPGHGSVEEDTHYHLPTAHLSREEWEAAHMPPFSSLIAQGIKFIMTAHIVYPALDNVNQATLSKSILFDILRGEMGFEGILVADALGMGSIRGDLESSATVVKALQAELDLFCLAGDNIDLGTAKTLATLMQQAVNEGIVSPDSMSRSRDRIEQTIASLPQHQPALLADSVFEAHQALSLALDPKGEWMKWQYIPKGFD